MIIRSELKWGFKDHMIRAKILQGIQLGSAHKSERQVQMQYMKAAHRKSPCMVNTYLPQEDLKLHETCKNSKKLFNVMCNWWLKYRPYIEGDQKDELHYEYQH